MQLDIGSLDKVLGNNESSSINEYFGVNKLNIVIAGGTGSGKSTYLLNLIMQNVFKHHNEYWFLPCESIQSGIVSKYITKMKQSNRRNNIFINDLSKHNVPSFNKFVQNKSNTANKDIMIFDDFINVVTKDEMNIIHRLLCNVSRLNSHLLLLCQGVSKLPPTICSNITIWVLFPCYLAKSQIRSIFTNKSTVSLTMKQIDQLIHIARSQDDKRIPLVVNSQQSIDKQIRFGNEYITFD